MLWTAFHGPFGEDTWARGVYWIDSLQRARNVRNEVSSMFKQMVVPFVNSRLIFCREANRSGVQSEASWPLDMAKTYCSSVILILFKVMNYGVYALFGGCVAMSFVFCYIKVNKYRTETAPLPEFGVEATKMAEVLELFLEKKHRKKARKPTKVAKHRNVKKA